MKPLNLLAAATLSLVLCPALYADYANITIDGDFSDWAAVGTFDTDGLDNAGSLDYDTLQIANDENFIYFRYTLFTAVNPQVDQVFVGIDEDNDATTGFDIFGLGLYGSEAGWQNDFPFEQATGVFNTGNGLTSATYTASPFNSVASVFEVSIDRNATHTVGGANIFPADGQTIGFVTYTTAGAGDFIGGSYTMMAPSQVPEPLRQPVMRALYKSKASDCKRHTMC